MKKYKLTAKREYAKFEQLFDNIIECKEQADTLLSDGWANVNIDQIDTEDVWLSDMALERLNSAIEASSLDSVGWPAGADEIALEVSYAAKKTMVH